KRKDGLHFLTGITDKDELEKIRRIASRLDEDENLLPCCKQSRMKPSDSAFAAANIVFATDKRIIIGNPTLHSFEKGGNYSDSSFSSMLSASSS
ncbi:MAG: hypothetical protein ACJ70T_08095, partial [Nitrososphaera sp.]